MEHKELLKAALNDLPVVMQPFLTKTMPTLGEIQRPGSVEDALMECGYLAKILTELCNRFAGLPVLEVPLRIGQLNPSMQVMAAAGLEYIGANFDMGIRSPATGAPYYGVFLDWSVFVTRSAQDAYWIRGRLDGEDMAMGPGDQKNEYTSNIAAAVGQHRFAVRAETQDGRILASREVLFSVLPWSDAPLTFVVNDGRLTAAVDLGGSNEAIESATIDVGGESFPLTYNNGSWRSAALDIALIVLDTEWHTVKTIITFLVKGGITGVIYRYVTRDI